MKPETCPRCLQGGYPGWLERHRVKPHRQCPLCPRSMIRLERHLAHHYWSQIEPMIREQIAAAPIVPDPGLR